MKGNPLLADGADVSLKRRWDDDTVFKNQARTAPKVKQRYINDAVRSDFHKKFLSPEPRTKRSARLIDSKDSSKDVLRLRLSDVLSFTSMFFSVLFFTFSKRPLGSFFKECLRQVRLGRWCRPLISQARKQLARAKRVPGFAGTATRGKALEELETLQRKGIQSEFRLVFTWKFTRKFTWKLVGNHLEITRFLWISKWFGKESDALDLSRLSVTGAPPPDDVPYLGL